MHIKALIRPILNKYGKRGVEALKEYTPKDTGLTSESWSYEVLDDQNGSRIVWRNSNVENGIVVAVLLQYGHATGTGGYVEGTDYINPAIQKVFQGIADEAWKEVTSRNGK